jgi:hypothetical protein
MLSEESRLVMFGNRVLKESLGLRGSRKQGCRVKYLMRRLIIRIHDPILSGDKIEKNNMGGREARMGRGKTYTGCPGEMWEMRPLGRLSCSWEKIIRRIFRKWDMVIWTG